MSQQLAQTTENRLREMPLGTAGWLTFPKGVWPKCEPGDFFLSNWPGGGPVGYRDDRHVMVVAGTRSGKGASILIPNLMNWPGSTVVIDPKGENAIVMARRRGRGSMYCLKLDQTVRVLDPFNEVKRSDDDFADVKVRFNPLDMVSENDWEAVDIAARIADALIVSEESKEPFWDEAGRGLLKALILHVASWPDIAPADRNLITVWRMASSGDRAARERLKGDGEAPSGLKLLFRAMARNPAFHGTVADAGAHLEDMYDGSPKTLMSIAGVIRTNLDFLSSQAMQNIVSRSDFRIEELKMAAKPSNIFLCLPQRYMHTHHRWLRMMTSLILAEMERISRVPKHPVLMVLDEFPSLGRMRVIEQAAAQIAGFGVKLVFVAQTLAQLKDTYRDNWETLVANAGVKIFFGNGDHFTRDYVSKLIGEQEISRTTQTRTASIGTSKSVAHGSNIGFSVNSGSSTSYGAQGWGGSASSGRSSNLGETLTSTHTTNQSQSVAQAETLHKRLLLTPDEVGREFGDLNRPMALALISGYQPLKLERIAYYSSPEAWGRYDAHPDHPPPPPLVQLPALRERERERKAALAREARLKAEAEARERAERNRRRDEAVRLKDERQRELRRQLDRERESKARAERAVELVKQIFWGLVGLFLLSYLVTLLLR